MLPLHVCLTAAFPALFGRGWHTCALPAYTAVAAQEQPPSYLGVNMRRAPTPLPAGIWENATASRNNTGDGSGSPGRGGARHSASSAPQWDPEGTLQWSNRGISTQKLPLLRDALMQGPQVGAEPLGMWMRDASSTACHSRARPESLGGHKGSRLMACLWG